MSRLVRMLYDEPLLLRALETRAARNFRKPKHELVVILRWVLAPELRELAAQLPDEPAERKEVSP